MRVVHVQRIKRKRVELAQEGEGIPVGKWKGNTT